MKDTGGCFDIDTYLIGVNVCGLSFKAEEGFTHL